MIYQHDLRSAFGKSQLPPLPTDQLPLQKRVAHIISHIQSTSDEIAKQRSQIELKIMLGEECDQAIKTKDWPRYRAALDIIPECMRQDVLSKRDVYELLFDRQIDDFHPVSSACSRNDVETLERIIDICKLSYSQLPLFAFGKRWPSHCESNTLTAPELAARQGSMDCLKLLVSHQPARSYLRSTECDELPHCAAQAPNSSVVKEIEQWPDVDFSLQNKDLLNAWEAAIAEDGLTSVRARFSGQRIASFDAWEAHGGLNQLDPTTFDAFFLALHIDIRVALIRLARRGPEGEPWRRTLSEMAERLQSHLTRETEHSIAHSRRAANEIRIVEYAIKTGSKELFELCWPRIQGQLNELPNRDKICLELWNSACGSGAIWAARNLVEFISEFELTFNLRAQLTHEDYAMAHIVAQRLPVSVIQEMCGELWFHSADAFKKVFRRMLKLEESGIDLGLTVSVPELIHTFRTKHQDLEDCAPEDECRRIYFSILFASKGEAVNRAADLVRMLHRAPGKSAAQLQIEIYPFLPLLSRLNVQVTDILRILRSAQGSSHDDNAALRHGSHVFDAEQFLFLTAPSAVNHREDVASRSRTPTSRTDELGLDFAIGNRLFRDRVRDIPGKVVALWRFAGSVGFSFSKWRYDSASLGGQTILEAAGMERIPDRISDDAPLPSGQKGFGQGFLLREGTLGERRMLFVNSDNKVEQRILSPLTRIEARRAYWRVSHPVWGDFVFPNHSAHFGRGSFDAAALWAPTNAAHRAMRDPSLRESFIAIHDRSLYNRAACNFIDNGPKLQQQLEAFFLYLAEFKFNTNRITAWSQRADGSTVLQGGHRSPGFNTLVDCLERIVEHSSHGESEIQSPVLAFVSWNAPPWSSVEYKDQNGKTQEELYVTTKVVRALRSLGNDTPDMDLLKSTDVHPFLQCGLQQQAELVILAPSRGIAKT